MKPAHWRLAVVAFLFIAWIAYLAFLAFTTRNPVVVSKPQIVASEFDVVAHRTGDNAFVIDGVLYPKGMDNEWITRTIVVHNLKDCETFSPEGKWLKKPPEMNEKVLLPLSSQPPEAKPETALEVSAIPPSPGYHPSESPHDPAGQPLYGYGLPRIYPDDTAVLRQFYAIRP